MFSRIIYIFNLIISFVTDGIRWIIAFLLIGMVISVLLTIISRYIIKISIPWTEELARYLMIWIAFLAGSLGLKRGVHVGIVFLVRKTSPRIKRYIGIISKLSMMFFFIVVTLEGYNLARFVSRQLSPALRISMAWVYSSLPISGVFFLLFLTQLLFDDIKALLMKSKNY